MNSMLHDSFAPYAVNTIDAWTRSMDQYQSQPADLMSRKVQFMSDAVMQHIVAQIKYNEASDQQKWQEREDLYASEWNAREEWFLAQLDECKQEVKASREKLAANEKLIKTKISALKERIEGLEQAIDDNMDKIKVVDIVPEVKVKQKNYTSQLD